MPCYEGSSDAVRAIRKAGAEVWICTTRPYLRLDNIDPDTRHWLRRNGIQYDGVIFGSTKYNVLRRIVGADRIVAVFDDLPEQYDRARNIGLPAMLRDQPYNRFRNDAERVSSSQEIATEAIRRSRQWSTAR